MPSPTRRGLRPSTVAPVIVAPLIVDPGFVADPVPELALRSDLPKGRPDAMMAGDIAAAAYRRLAAGDRRGGASGLREAVAMAAGDLRAADWQAQLRRLEARWSGDAWLHLRGGSAGGGPASLPLLGGSQTGGSLRWTPDPLASSPVAVSVRISAPLGDLDDGGQVALGMVLQPLPVATLAVERLVPTGAAARAAWTVRIAGGVAGHAGGSVAWSVYSEAGIIGAHRRDLYAAGLARAGWQLAPAAGVSVRPGLGAWGSVQKSGQTVHRLDAGPTVQVRLETKPVPLDLALDYRVRVAGNAAPGSGVALTLSTGF